MTRPTTHGKAGYDPREAAWRALCMVDGLGLNEIHALITQFDGDTGAIIRAPAAELRRVHGIGPVLAGRINGINLTAARAEEAQWAKRGVRALMHDQLGYPMRLHKEGISPPAIYAQGNSLLLSYPRVATIGIVGTREPSADALAAAARIAAAHARAGTIVVSGLALGIDACAHTAALDAGGLTAAVLGCGLLHLYPPENRGLAARIVEAGGVMISETRPDLEVRRDRLVARNRLIAALCDTLIVVESAADGGAMHAARWASKLGVALFTLDRPASGNQAMIAAGVPVYEE